MSLSPAVLVTGANGLVGSRLVARLAAGEGCEKASVIAAGRGPSRGQAVASVEYVELDLLQPGRLAELIEQRRPQAVLHAAAMTDVDACEREPVAAWTLNVDSTAAAARACQRVGAHLVALSTDYVFTGGPGQRPFGEDDLPDPRGTYARSKRAGEEAALLLCPQAAVARVAVIYSGRAGAKRTFALGVAENLRAGKPVKAFADQTVSPTLADNAAQMVIGLMQSRKPGIWHCAGATPATRVEFCRALARKLGADEALVEGTRLAEAKLPSPRPAYSALDVRRIGELLPAGGPLSLDAALDRFLEELRGAGLLR